MSIKQNDPDTIQCDFCDMEARKDITGWRYAMRGKTWPTNVSVCEALPLPLRHACTDELCQAKLMIWARS